MRFVNSTNSSATLNQHVRPACGSADINSADIQPALIKLPTCDQLSLSFSYKTPNTVKGPKMETVKQQRVHQLLHTGGARD